MTEVAFLRQFGINLTGMLEYCNTTQKELAEDIDVSESTISRYARGLMMPSLKHLVNIAYSLDCDLDDLVDIDEFIE